MDITPSVAGAFYFTFGAANGDPVAAQKYTPHITANGTNLPVSPQDPVPTFCVGQQINFALSTTAPYILSDGAFESYWQILQRDQLSQS